MILYTLFLVVSSIIVLGLNLLFKVASPLYIIILFVVGFLLEVIIDALVALIVHKLPSKIANPNLRIYKVYKFERKIYERLGIKKWKSLVPETGGLCNFKKDKIYDPNNSEYLHKFMVETCYAELLHFISAFMSFVVLFLGNGITILTICLPLAIMNFIVQILPALIQRYVRPRINVLYQRRLRIEKVSQE